MPTAAPAPDPRAGLAAEYRTFADEARGRSPAYQLLAESVAADPGLLRFLTTLPEPKRQPNLLFAAARYLLRRPADTDDLRDLVRSRHSDLTAVMMTRRTQTNEPARCATILPALAALPEPLALIEVGASAGLTLLFDQYSYDYAGNVVRGADPDAPLLPCRPEGPVPVPAVVPVISWRGRSRPQPA